MNLSNESDFLCHFAYKIKNVKKNVNGPKWHIVENLQNFIFWEDNIDHNKVIMSSSFHIQLTQNLLRFCSVWATKSSSFHIQWHKICSDFAQFELLSIEWGSYWNLLSDGGSVGWCAVLAYPQNFLLRIICGPHKRLPKNLDTPLIVLRARYSLVKGERIVRCELSRRQHFRSASREEYMYASIWISQEKNMG